MREGATTCQLYGMQEISLGCWSRGGVLEVAVRCQTSSTIASFRQLHRREAANFGPRHGGDARRRLLKNLFHRLGPSRHRKAASNND